MKAEQVEEEDGEDRPFQFQMIEVEANPEVMSYGNSSIISVAKMKVF